MITGRILVGHAERTGGARFQAINPATGEALPQEYHAAGPSDVSDACALAHAAARTLADQEPRQRAAFLEASAQAILDLGDDLVTTAMAESGLPRARLEGERIRTVNQLRLFAAVVRQGDYLDVTIDPALPERTPPRADLRRMNRAIGPVAVFAASNFPLAFSVGGGDTASALAAGCPVVVKGHPAHPGTGEMVARAIISAGKTCGLPEGVFSYLPGQSHALGEALVRDPRIQAVGFTGSRNGGLALAQIAAERTEPIPVFAEMSSINPVVCLPAALENRAEQVAEGYIGSLTMGAGQFCTNPGLVLAIDGPALDRFIVAAAGSLAKSEPTVMLTPEIHAAYGQGVGALDNDKSARRVGGGSDSEEPNRCVGALFEASGREFIANDLLAREVFGSSSVIVRCSDEAELHCVLERLEGQLTATLQMDAPDSEMAARVLPLLTRKAGRILANGWPTGVEVCHAMVHGGPFPATTDSRSTSVGSLAIARFLRPVCYQDIPDTLLPPALQSGNPWQLPRRVDGEIEHP